MERPITAQKLLEELNKRPLNLSIYRMSISELYFWLQGYQACLDSLETLKDLLESES